MAHLYQSTITRWMDENGNRCSKDTHGSQRIKSKSKTWLGRYKDNEGITRSISLKVTNKQAAKEMLATLELEAARERGGLASPFRDHEKQPLKEHLTEFVQSLRDTGKTEDYCRLRETRIRTILEGCKFRFIGDVSASGVQSFLALLQRDGNPFVASEKRKPIGKQTAKHYLTAVKQFTRWLVRDRRTGDNPLIHLTGPKMNDDDRKIVRRELSRDEIGHLLNAARTGESYYGLTGFERFMLYTLALGAGLRASEAASTKAKSFDLATTLPTVRIEASIEKSRRGTRQPLPGQTADLFREWFAQRKLTPETDVWSGRWAKNRYGSKLMQFDLTEARSRWIENSATAEERADRERSDFLAYRNDEGEQADFHALRHTYLSRLGRSGASPKVMQKCGRHTTVELTIGRYGHASTDELHAAVNAMELLPTEPDSPDTMQATGTDDSRPTLRGAGMDGCQMVVLPDATDPHTPAIDCTSEGEFHPFVEDDPCEHKSLPLQLVADDCASLPPSASGEGGDSNPILFFTHWAVTP
jgi:integrase/recombinase XerD